MKKVAIVYPYIAHYRSPIFEKLSEQNNDDNIEFDIYCGQTTLFKGLNIFDKNKHKPPFKVNWLKNHWFLKRFLFQSGLKKLIKYDDVIFLGDYQYLSVWLYTIILRLNGVNVYYWTHGCLKPEYSIKGKIRRFFYGLSSGLLLYGNKAKGILKEHGFPEKKLHVIYNSLDHEKQYAFYCKNLPVTKNKDIIYIGRLNKDKNVSLLLDAVSQINDNENAISVTIVGDGNDRISLEEKSKKLYLDVSFTGAIYDEYELSKIIMSHKLCVIPGDLGLSAMHVMGYGLPVISHDNIDSQKPESEVLIDYSTGLHYKYGSSSSLADCIKIVLSDYKSYEIRCIESIIESYTPSAQQKLILKVIEDGYK
ncbi:MAG: glycosyltransferase family 4 protein [Vibrionaceae bacterium]|nr:glycosyltransferase family 4 protein [Vibrionaceae bacterium]